jgi:hypothetical protein
MKYSRFLQVLGVFMIALSTRAGAQTKQTVVLHGNLLDQRVVPAACCVVTAIDLVKGVVSGRETATGYTFKFTVIPGKMSAQDSTQLIRKITINQKVWASLQGKGVKVDYDKPICCMIIEEADH